jgi:hypothetical protein
MQHCKLLKTYQHSNIGAKRTQFQWSHLPVT